MADELTILSHGRGLNMPIIGQLSDVSGDAIDVQLGFIPSRVEVRIYTDADNFRIITKYLCQTTGASEHALLVSSGTVDAVMATITNLVTSYAGSESSGYKKGFTIAASALAEDDVVTFTAWP